MKIIVTKSFEKNLKKDCKDIDIDFLIDKIKIESKNFISFKEPFFKVKIKSKNKSYRLILNYEKEYLTIIFIKIFDKKDKKIWENINWNLHKDMILGYYKNNLKDIGEWEYKVFKI